MEWLEDRTVLSSSQGSVELPEVPHLSDLGRSTTAEAGQTPTGDTLLKEVNSGSGESNQPPPGFMYASGPGYPLVPVNGPALRGEVTAQRPQTAVPFALGNSAVAVAPALLAGADRGGSVVPPTQPPILPDPGSLLSQVLSDVGTGTPIPPSGGENPPGTVLQPDPAGAGRPDEGTVQPGGRALADVRTASPFAPQQTDIVRFDSRGPSSVTRSAPIKGQDVLARIVSAMELRNTGRPTERPDAGASGTTPTIAPSGPESIRPSSLEVSAAALSGGGGELAVANGQTLALPGQDGRGEPVLAGSIPAAESVPWQREFELLSPAAWTPSQEAIDAAFPILSISPVLGWTAENAPWEILASLVVASGFYLAARNQGRAADQDRPRLLLRPRE